MAPKRQKKKNQKIKTVETHENDDHIAIRSPPSSHLSTFTGVQIFSDRDFIVEKVIAKGGYGTVYRGRIISSNQEIAVKRCLNEGLTISQDILREIAFLSFFQGNPLVTNLHGIVSQQQSVKLIYDFYPRLLSNYSPIAPSAVKAIGFALFTVISQMASAGLAHRDIKTSNVLLTSSREPKLADFGLAGTIPDHCWHRGICTIDYRPIEVLLGDSKFLDGRCDVWSIGMLLYKIADGHHLIDAQGTREALFYLFDEFGDPNPKTWSDLPNLPRYDIFPDLVREWKESSSATKDGSKIVKSSGKREKEMTSDDSISKSKEEKEGIPLASTTDKSQQRKLGPKFIQLQKRLRARDGWNDRDIENFLDLLLGCFVYDPSNRLSPSEALLHPFFGSLKNKLTGSGKKKSAIRTRSPLLSSLQSGSKWKPKYIGCRIEPAIVPHRAEAFILLAETAAKMGCKDIFSLDILTDGIILFDAFCKIRSQRSPSSQNGVDMGEEDPSMNEISSPSSELAFPLLLDNKNENYPTPSSPKSKIRRFSCDNEEGENEMNFFSSNLFSDLFLKMNLMEEHRQIIESFFFGKKTSSPADMDDSRTENDYQTYETILEELLVAFGVTFMAFKIHQDYYVDLSSQEEEERKEKEEKKKKKKEDQLFDENADIGNEKDEIEWPSSEESESEEFSTDDEWAKYVKKYGSSSSLSSKEEEDYDDNEDDNEEEDWRPPKRRSRHRNKYSKEESDESESPQSNGHKAPRRYRRNRRQYNEEEEESHSGDEGDDENEDSESGSEEDEERSEESSSTKSSSEWTEGSDLSPGDPVDPTLWNILNPLGLPVAAVKAVEMGYISTMGFDLLNRQTIRWHFEQFLRNQLPSLKIPSPPVSGHSLLSSSHLFSSRRIPFEPSSSSSTSFLSTMKSEINRKKLTGPFYLASFICMISPIITSTLHISSYAITASLLVLFIPSLIHFLPSPNSSLFSLLSSELGSPLFQNLLKFHEESAIELRGALARTAEAPLSPISLVSESLHSLSLLQSHST